MDFSVDPALEEHLAAVSGYVQDRLVPLEAVLLAQEWGTLWSTLEECRTEIRARGWWAPNLPASAGGTGADLVTLGLISEVLGQTPTGHYAFGCQAPDAGNSELLLLHGSDEQKARYLEPLAQGRVRSCFLMTEPEYPGSNPVLMGTTATADGDEWVIDGHKWFATAADGAAFGICMAVTDPEAARHQRASMILVDMNAPGVELVAASTNAEALAAAANADAIIGFCNPELVAAAPRASWIQIFSSGAERCLAADAGLGECSAVAFLHRKTHRANVLGRLEQVAHVGQVGSTGRVVEVTLDVIDDLLRGRQVAG